MFNSNSNLLTASGLSAEQCDDLLAGHGDLEGLGQAFIDVENSQGINAFWGMAQAIQEVGWSGHSAIADDKHNLFGITAYDSNPYGDASGYSSFTACVAYWGSFLKDNYLTPGGAYWVSATPAGIARHYASDPNYAAEIVSIMNILVGRVKNGGGDTFMSAPNPVPAPAGNIYTVSAGQNMSVIANLVGMTLSQLESLNPQAGHPAGNFDVIWPGDQLHVGQAAPAPTLPVPSIRTVTVEAGDSLSLIANREGLMLNQIEQMNPTVGHPAGNFDVIWPGDTIRVS